MTNKIR